MGDALQVIPVAAFKLGVPTVKVEGNDIVNMLKMTAHNGPSANAPAGASERAVATTAPGSVLDQIPS